VLQALFHRLSPDDVYTRFFRRVRSLSFAELQTLCNVNHGTVTIARDENAVHATLLFAANTTTEAVKNSSF
jgi:hypothetical protein